jgi:hypothetical protein
LFSHAEFWTHPPDEVVIAASEFDGQCADKWAARWNSAMAWCKRMQISGTGEVATAAMNRNRGWSQATEPWVRFVDADDVYRPERMSIVLQMITKNSNINIRTLRDLPPRV